MGEPGLERKNLVVREKSLKLEECLLRRGEVGQSGESRAVVQQLDLKLWVLMG